MAPVDVWSHIACDVTLHTVQVLFDRNAGVDLMSWLCLLGKDLNVVLYHTVPDALRSIDLTGTVPIGELHPICYFRLSFNL